MKTPFNHINHSGLSTYWWHSISAKIPSEAWLETELNPPNFLEELEATMSDFIYGNMSAAIKKESLSESFA